MTDQSDTVPAVDTYSAEFVANLKKELESERAEKLDFKSKLGTWETQRRNQLAEMAPVVSEWIKEGMEAGAEFKQEMLPMANFGENLAEAANLDSAMPLARMISCHSARIKRERAEFSQASGAAEALGKANKELDVLRDDAAVKTKRIEELEGLVAERTEAAGKLQEELSRAGLVAQKYDFSSAASRETAPSGTSSPSIAAKTPAAPMADPLLAFVTRAGGAGAGRIGLSNTGHHLLGSQGGAGGESDITSALRFA